MDNNPSSTNNEEESIPPSIAPPQDQIEDDNAPATTTTPPSSGNETTPSQSTGLLLPSTSDYSNDNNNPTTPNVKIETNEYKSPPKESPMSFLAMPDEIGSSPFVNNQDDKKPSPKPTPAKALPTSLSNDNFLSSVLAATTPTNLSNLPFGSAHRPHQEYDYFSNFDFESLNGIFSPNGAVVVAGGNNGAANNAVLNGATQIRLGTQPVHPQPPVEAFPLPPYLQGQLDETYAASTLIFPTSNTNAAENGIFYQVTAYRHVPGAAYPAAAGFLEDKENAPPLTGASKPKKTKARPLPLRKRPLMEQQRVENRGPKKALIRHNMPEAGAKVMCRCKNSKCLKLYCDCFRNGKVCRSKECGCTGCKNTISNSGPDGIRTKTITEILKRRPDAFDKREKVVEGCRCKKNQCIKKYCVCFNVGAYCNESCQCTGCRNYPGAKLEDDDEEEEQVEEEEEEVVTKPVAYVEIPNKAHLLDAAVEGSVSASEGSSTMEDKRLRHSKSKRDRKEKPQDQDQESPESFGRYGVESSVPVVQAAVMQEQV